MSGPLFLPEQRESAETEGGEGTRGKGGGGAGNREKRFVRYEVWCPLSSSTLNIIIFTGIYIYLPSFCKVIGENSIAVPTHLYKVVLAEKRDEPPGIGESERQYSCIHSRSLTLHPPLSHTLPQSRNSHTPRSVFIIHPRSLSTHVHHLTSPPPHLSHPPSPHVQHLTSPPPHLSHPPSPHTCSRVHRPQQTPWF